MIHLISAEDAFQLLKTQVMVVRPTNMQQLEVVAVKSWENISREEGKHLMMSMFSRLQTVADCKELSFN